MELDSKIGGGLPLGSLTLIEGGSGSGKSVLAHQMLWGALLDGFTASIFTSENTIRSLIAQMQKLDSDLLDFVLLNKCRIYPMALTKLGDHATAALLDAISAETGRTLIVVNSLTAAVIHDTEDAPIFRFFEGCQRLCATGTTIIVTLHAQGVERRPAQPDPLDVRRRSAAARRTGRAAHGQDARSQQGARREQHHRRHRRLRR